MMRKRCLLSLCTAVLLYGIMRPNNSLIAQSQTNYIFAYASQPQPNGQVFIKTIDPNNLGTPQTLLTLSIPVNAYVQTIIPSPNGNWLALGYTGGTVQIVNVVTHDIHNIPLVAVFNTGDVVIAGPSQYLAWSPNSQYIALIGRANNLENAYLYNVQTNNLIALNTSTAQKFRVAWSLDSTRLATLSEYCTSVNTCSDYIETFALPTLNRQSSAKIIDVGATAFDTVVCQIEWSPAASFISFVTNCDPSRIEAVKETYLLTISQSTIVPVTNYTTQTTDPNNGGPPIARLADYDTTWFDPHTLLIGAIFRNNAGNYTDSLTQTVAVRVTDYQTTVMSASMAEDWAINPHTGELAYRSSTLNSNGQLSLQSQNASVQFGFLVGSHVLSGTTAPPGCDLKWTPNGTFLAYDQRSGTTDSCADAIQSFVFIDDASHTVKQQAINPSENAIEIGWLSLTASNTPTPSNTSAATNTPSATNTFTPTPTNTATPTKTSTPTYTFTPTSTPTSTFTPTATPTPVEHDTIGVFRKSNGTFYLRNSNTTGNPDITVAFNPATKPLPVTGNWGIGADTIGIFDQANDEFSLRNSNSSGNPDIQFAFGDTNDDVPLSGHWTSDMAHDGVGTYRPSVGGEFFVRKTLTTGYADFTVLLGVPGDLAVTGDWNGDGIDSPGVYRPTNNTFYLSNTVTNGTVTANYTFSISGTSCSSNCAPIAGDWTGQGHDGVGLFSTSGATFWLKNQLATGAADNSFIFGTANDLPVVGQWSSH